MAINLFLTTVFWLFSASLNSFMGYAYMYYQHLKELSLYVLRCLHCMLSFHGFPWVIFLSPHWYVQSSCIVVFSLCLEILLTDIPYRLCVLAWDTPKTFSCSIISESYPSMFDRGTSVFHCSRVILVFNLQLLSGHCLFWFLQVAALNFGDFYNVQYVKMYSIFMVQLQVCQNITSIFICNWIFDVWVL